MATDDVVSVSGFCSSPVSAFSDSAATIISLTAAVFSLSDGIDFRPSRVVVVIVSGLPTPVDVIGVDFRWRCACADNDVDAAAVVAAAAVAMDLRVR